MAFSFFGNYNKPGPGVSKDEPQKPPFIRFFQLYFRKFFNLIKLNLLFLVPVVVVFALVFLISRITTISYICNLPLILLSPFVAGITFVTRNYAREEHAFIFSDFKDAVLNNWKQFLLNGIFGYIISSILSFCLSFYYSLCSNGPIYYIPFGIAVGISMVFVFSQYYIPMMIVTFELTTKQLYKNSLIFAIVGLWKNLLITIIFAFLFFLNYLLFYMFSALMILIDILLILFFAFSFCSFLINFTIYPLIDKMMIQPFYAKQNGEGALPGDEDNEPIAEDDVSAAAKAEEDKKEKASAESEYVFVNGRLVKKSTLEENKED